jgi:hypothetical protein
MISNREEAYVWNNFDEIYSTKLQFKSRQYLIFPWDDEGKNRSSKNLNSKEKNYLIKTRIKFLYCGRAWSNIKKFVN